MPRTREVNVLLVRLQALEDRILALEEKTKGYSWFLKMLLSALALAVMTLVAAHLSLK